MNRHVMTACSVVVLASFVGTAGANDIAEAAKNRDLGALRLLLNEQSDPSVPMLDGSTALHWAANWEDIEMVDLLIGAGAKVDAANRNGVTPLALATTKGNAPVIERLLEAGADPNETVLLNGETALMLAARTGSRDAAQRLIEYGADVNAREALRGTTPLMWAAAADSADIAQLLVEQEVDVDAQSTVTALPPPQRCGTNCDSPGNTDGFTALTIAARERSLETVGVLLAAGADPNRTTADGTSAMLIATMNGDFDVANALLQAGGDPDLYNDKRWSVLFSAVDNHNEEWGIVPLAHDSELSAREWIRILLDYGADPNVQSLQENLYRTPNSRRPYWKLRSTGATPFLRASMSGDLETMRLLLAYGADWTITSVTGTTPLMAASGLGWGDGYSYEHSEAETLGAMQLMLDLGADVNRIKESDGATAMHGAAHKGSTAAVQFLVDNGADLAIPDNGLRNQTRIPLIPLQYALGFTYSRSAAFNETTAVQSETSEQILQLMEDQGLPIPNLVTTGGVQSVD